MSDTLEKMEHAYADYKMYEQLANAKKEEFYKFAEELYLMGIEVTSEGKRIRRKTRKSKKLDQLMLSVLHPEIYEELIKEGKFTIPMEAIADRKEEVSDCIIQGNETVFYTLD